MKKSKILIISSALLITLLATGLSLNAFAATSQNAKGLTISLNNNSLTPFNIIKISGKSFDTTASTSVIFRHKGSFWGLKS